MKFIQIAIDPSKRWVHSDGSGDEEVYATLYALGDDGSIHICHDPSGWQPQWRQLEGPSQEP